MHGAAQMLGFALLGGIFVWAGARHFLHFRSVAGELERRRYPLPALLLGAGSALEIGAGLALAAGFMRPYAAAALIAFTVAATLMLVDFWRHSGAERQNLQSVFILNVAVVGGLLIAATS
jgi:putative oxidoreductase